MESLRSRHSIGICQMVTSIVSLLVLLRLQGVTCFSPITTSCRRRQPFCLVDNNVPQRYKNTMLLDRKYYDDDEDDDEEEFARVRRRGGRGYDREEVESVADYVSRGESRSKGKYYEDDEEDEYDDDEYDYYDDEEDESDDDDEDFDDILIPNSQLDSMDPDGAAERFGELASDPKFWFEFTLFVLFYNFILYLGRDIDISYMVS